MEFPGHTLANAQELAHGNFDGSHDATWFATNRYVAMTDGENTSGRSYEEFKQYYDGLREEKNQYRSLSFSSTRLMAASTRYSRGFVLTKIIPPRSPYSGHSPLAQMPRTLAEITAQSASITPSAPKFPRAKETCFSDSPKNLRGIVAAGGVVGLHFIVGIGFVASSRSCSIWRRRAVDNA